MTKSEFQQFQKQFFESILKLSQAKNDDYTGTGDDPFANFKRSRRVLPEEGLLLRVEDKIARIESFLDKGTLSVANESAVDACMDVAAYMSILAGLIEAKREPKTKAGSITFLNMDKVYMKQFFHDYLQKIKDFNRDAGTPLNRVWLEDDEFHNEVKMLYEELEELEDAIATRNRIEVADALTDIVYVALGTSQKLGIDIERCLAEVCRSNASKYFVQDNGSRVLKKNEDGKIIKGPNYSEPDLSFTETVNE